MAVKSFYRSRSTRRKALSGIDLPEVAPFQGIEVRPAERGSHIPPQSRYVDSRYASGLEPVHVEEGKGPVPMIVPDETASTKGFLPSDSKPHVVERQPFWRNKRARWWMIGIAVAIAIFLAVVIAVAATLSLSHKSAPVPAPVASTVTASPSASPTPPAASPTKGCPTYTGPALSSLPSSISRPGGAAPTPGASNKIANITFSQAFSYDVANSDKQTTSNAFTSIPQGFAYAIGGDVASTFVINTFTPIDTTPQQCYIATTAQVNVPAQYEDQLKKQAEANRNDPSVLLWHNPNGNIADLFNKIQSITFS